MASSFSLMMLLLSMLMLAMPASADVDNSKLYIRSPPPYDKEGGYDHREALFGSPPYGSSIRGVVFYANSTLCNPTQQAAIDAPYGGYPQRYDGSTWLEAATKEQNGVSSFILVVDRGDCTFVSKVRNAQRAGAAAVIIADNSCLCSDQDCIDKNPTYGSKCETSEPILADDGSGADISIPSMLMFKTDADMVKAQRRAPDMPMIMELSWASTVRDHVNYELWTTPTDSVSNSFLQGFDVFAQALGDRATFAPRSFIYDGVRAGCQGTNGEKFCYNLCTNHGRYCATGPGSDLDHGTTGADVVRESLRRTCIWKLYGEDGIGLPYWIYANNFLKNCNNEELFADLDCVADAQEDAGVDASLVNQCVRESGGLDDDVPNSLLHTALESQSQRGIVVMPSILINGVVLRGKLTPESVFGAICASLSDPPSSCRCVESCEHDVLHCVESQECTSPPSSDSAGNESYSTQQNTSNNNGFMDVLAESPAALEFVGKLPSCGIDMEGLVETVADLSAQIDGNSGSMKNEVGILTGLSAITDLLKESPLCTTGETNDFQVALEDFRTCSGYDMLELEELFPSALVGGLLKCATSFMSAMSEMDLTSRNVELDMPRECTEALLGPHPLGRAMRQYYLHPDETIPCFKSFSTSVPQCYLDLWPIPVDGAWLSRGACIAGSLMPILEEVCVSLLAGLEDCLALDGKTDSDWKVSCDKVTASCRGGTDSMLFSLPPSLLGVPLPDTCARIAEQTGLLASIERYDKFRTSCAPVGTKLWMDLESETTGSSFQKYTDFISGSTVDFTDATSSSLESSSTAQLAVDETATSSDMVFGVAIGFSLAVSVMGLILAMRRKLSGSKQARVGVATKYERVKVEDAAMA